jgi:hypothetical protein
MPTYEPQTSYASKIDEDETFVSAAEAAAFDQKEATEICAGYSQDVYLDLIRNPHVSALRDLRRAIIYLADLIREGEEKKAEPLPETTWDMSLYDGDKHVVTFTSYATAADAVVAAMTSSHFDRIELLRIVKRLEPTQEDFFKAYADALAKLGPSRACSFAEHLRYHIRAGEYVPMSNESRTAWRAIGLDGETTAERIRALRETRG